MLRQTLGSAIKQLRLAKGLTQKDLAKKVGVTSGYLSQLENDHRDPTVSLLSRIASATGVSLPVIQLMTLDAEDVPAEKRSMYHEVRPHLSKLLEGILESVVEDTARTKTMKQNRSALA